MKDVKDMSKMTDDTIALRLENLTSGYRNKKILKDIDLSCQRNKITAILGQSGCGKSTLLKSITGLVKDEGGYISGEILLEGKKVGEIPLEDLRKSVGMVFQRPVMFPTSILENLLLPLNYHYSRSKEEQRGYALNYLEMVGLGEELKDKLQMQANKLSGGQQQRLSIARCLCTQPEIIMLDEPCSSLDMKNTKLIEELLLELKKDYTIMIVTHNIAQARRISDEIIFMDEGRIVEVNGSEEFFQGPKTDLAKEYLSYMEF